MSASLRVVSGGDGADRLEVRLDEIPLAEVQIRGAVSR